MTSSIKRSAGLDDASKALLFEGANLSQLGVLFRMDHRVLVEKLHGVAPSGKRGHASTWMVHEVAPYLVRPHYDIEAYIKRMNHADLPKMLTKEFWSGQRAKQEYLLLEGDLWPTAKVVEEVGELFKLMRMQIRLASDAVERQTDLTPRQRTIIRGLLDGTLSDLTEAIKKKFAPKESGNADHDDEEL
ncbi:MAG: hypothetical protein KDG50_06995 [Chromatiales bacterium]|nr:hypothetical protein [Chromatiales bacterium]